MFRDEGEEAMDEKLGPLHGIPIVVKDSIYQQGKVSNFGMAYLCEYPADTDSLVLWQFIQAGAIPLVKSNTSAGDFLVHSNNEVFGDSINPIDSTRICCADGALVASKCAPLALSSDIGSHLRVSAATSGTFSFMPTASRVTQWYDAGNPKRSRVDHFTQFQPVCGTIGNSPDDCILGFKAQVNASATDVNPFMTPCPWNDEKFLLMTEEEGRNRIKVGILQESISLPLSDATKRAIKITE